MGKDVYYCVIQSSGILMGELNVYLQGDILVNYRIVYSGIQVIMVIQGCIYWYRKLQKVVYDLLLNE